MPLLPPILALAAVVPHLAAARAAHPPKLDGRLDDAVWQKASPSDGFTQKTPVDGKAPGERTTRTGRRSPAPAGLVSSRVLVDPDYRAGAINASLVLRWECHLGSTLYVAYTHNQSRSATPRFGDSAGYDFTLVRPSPAEDALLLDLSCWWG